MQEERKTLEQRAQMTNIERHLTAHLLASCHVDRSVPPWRDHYFPEPTMAKQGADSGIPRTWKVAPR